MDASFELQVMQALNEVSPDRVVVALGADGSSFSDAMAWAGYTPWAVAKLCGDRSTHVTVLGPPVVFEPAAGEEVGEHCVAVARPADTPENVLHAFMDRAMTLHENVLNVRTQWPIWSLDDVRPLAQLGETDAVRVSVIPSLIPSLLDFMAHQMVGHLHWVNQGTVTAVAVRAWLEQHEERAGHASAAPHGIACLSDDNMRRYAGAAPDVWAALANVCASRCEASSNTF